MKEPRSAGGTSGLPSCGATRTARCAPRPDSSCAPATPSSRIVGRRSRQPVPSLPRPEGSSTTTRSVSATGRLPASGRRASAGSRPTTATGRSRIEIEEPQSQRNRLRLAQRTSCGSPASTSIGCPFADRPAVSRTVTALPLPVRGSTAHPACFVGLKPVFSKRADYRSAAQAVVSRPEGTLQRSAQISHIRPHAAGAELRSGRAVAMPMTVAADLADRLHRP
jgi:hypothetical protein